jgi:hypothetical protein
MCKVLNVMCNSKSGFWQYRGYRPRYLSRPNFGIEDLTLLELLFIEDDNDY